MPGSNSGLDQFGRELRPDVPTAAEGQAAPIPVHVAPSHTVSLPTSQMSTIPSSASIPSVMTPQTGAGLANFDLTTFDFGNPQSWSTLGEAWKMTHGKPPTQEELMTFVMSGGTTSSLLTPSADVPTFGANPSGGMSGDWGSSNPLMGGGVGPEWSINGQQQRGGFQRGRGRGRDGGGGGGGFSDRGGRGGGYMHSVAGQSSDRMWSADSSNMNYGRGNNLGGGGQRMHGAPSTPLNGGSSFRGGGPTSIVDAVIAEAMAGGQTESEDRPKAAGKMIKVGDRWQWVKAGEA